MPQTDEATILATERIIKKFYSEYDPLTDKMGMDFYAEDILRSYGWTFPSMTKNSGTLTEVESTLVKYLIEEWDY